jgi:hypothetical protein
MYRVGDSNLSYACLTSPKTLARLRRLRKTIRHLTPNLPDRLPRTVLLPNSSVEEVFFQQEVCDDCHIPLDVVSSLVGGEFILGNFAIGGSDLCRRRREI